MHVEATCKDGLKVTHATRGHSDCAEFSDDPVQSRGTVQHTPSNGRNAATIARNFHRWSPKSPHSCTTRPNMTQTKRQQPITYSSLAMAATIARNSPTLTPKIGLKTSFSKRELGTVLLAHGVIVLRVIRGAFMITQLSRTFPPAPYTYRMWHRQV